MPPEALLTQAPEWALPRSIAIARGTTLAMAGSEAGANVVSAGLARTLATSNRSSSRLGSGLSQLEARYDRAIGMLLRPPSRLFGEAGLEHERGAGHAHPTRRLGSDMGGAFIPPSLVAQFADLLDRHAERLALRMTEAYLDAPALLAILIEAATYAAAQGKGLFEAADVIVPGVPASYPPGLRLVTPDRSSTGARAAPATGGGCPSAEESRDSLRDSSVAAA